MKANEIENTPAIDVERDAPAGYDRFWLREIALQLAHLNGWFSLQYNDQQRCPIGSPDGTACMRVRGHNGDHLGTNGRAWISLGTVVPCGSYFSTAGPCNLPCGHAGVHVSPTGVCWS